MNIDTEFWLRKPNGEFDPYKLALLGSAVLAFAYIAASTFLV